MNSSPRCSWLPTAHLFKMFPWFSVRSKYSTPPNSGTSLSTKRVISCHHCQDLWCLLAYENIGLDFWLGTCGSSCPTSYPKLLQLTSFSWVFHSHQTLLFVSFSLFLLPTPSFSLLSHGLLCPYLLSDPTPHHGPVQSVDQVQSTIFSPCCGFFWLYFC